MSYCDWTNYADLLYSSSSIARCSLLSYPFMWICVCVRVVLLTTYDKVCRCSQIEFSLYIAPLSVLPIAGIYHPWMTKLVQVPVINSWRAKWIPEPLRVITIGIIILVVGHGFTICSFLLPVIFYDFRHVLYMISHFISSIAFPLSPSPFSFGIEADVSLI